MARKAGLSSMLMIIYLDDEELRTSCRTLSIYTIGDLVDLKLAGACWYIPGTLTPQAAYLPDVVPDENSLYGSGNTRNYRMTMEK